MPIRLDNNGKRKALICEESKPETRYEEHIRIEEEKEFKRQRKNKQNGAGEGLTLQGDNGESVVLYVAC